MCKLILQGILMIAAAMFGNTAAAHGTDEAVVNAWILEPWLVSLLSLAVGLYFIGCLRLHAAGNLRKVVDVFRIASFAGGILALVAALLSPLDALADQLFSAHMMQHLILMIVAPPLLVHGRPALLAFWSLPVSMRHLLAQWWNGRAQLRVLNGFLLHPFAVWAAASMALWFWHIPAFYAWASGNENVHLAEHLSFFLTSLAFWSVLLQSGSRHHHGTALLLISAFALHSGLLGALLTFASQPLYAPGDPQAYGLTALEDQQLAGLMMWIPMGLIYLTALASAFMRWMEAAEIRQRRRWRRQHDLLSR